MSSNESNCPVFIHSLWRSGSTYIFNAFRRSPKGYCCYQESVHEIALRDKDSPERLLTVVSAGMEALRHPPLEKPYFLELYEAHRFWAAHVAKEIFYDDYFGLEGDERLLRYLLALTRGAKGRPIFQECRTSCRIALIRRPLTSSHIYLWRNPRDQWHSTRVTKYFDAVIQLVIGARRCPIFISRIREAIGLSEFHHDDVYEEIRHFRSNVLSSERSYLAFYALWCLGLIEGAAHADLLLNIDRLSDSPAYQSEFLKRLRRLGITDVTFSDCRIPQRYYGAAEKAFFARIEKRVHRMLAETGYPRTTVESLSVLKRSNAPRSPKQRASV